MWRTVKVWGCFAAALFFSIVSCFEAISQLPKGVASPLQLPLMTTPVLINIPSGIVSRAAQGKLSSNEKTSLSELGRNRLLREPLDSRAIWLYSFSESHNSAIRLLNLAEKVSRRDRIVQIELMKNEALAGNLEASLRHLDIALTVSPNARIDILKGISAGLNEQQLIDMLSIYQERPWFDVLVQQAVLHSPRAIDAGNLLMATNLGVDDLPPRLLASAIARMVDEGEFGFANKIAARFVNIDSTDLVNFGPNIRNIDEEARPLAWTLFTDADLLTEITGKVVNISLEGGRSGTALSRVTTFKKANYRVIVAARGSSPDLKMNLIMGCWDRSKFVMSKEQYIPLKNYEQTFSISFLVNESCPAQSWSFELSNINGSSEANAWLTSISIVQ